MVILDTYKEFFLNNLDKIIYFFLIFFYLFIVIQFFSFNDYFKEVSSNCVGCFSILKIFFKENSHLALIAPSVIFYLLFISNYNKFINYFSVIIFLLICFVNPSLTLYIGLVILFFSLLFFKLKLFKFKIFFLILINFFALFKISVAVKFVFSVRNFLFINSLYALEQDGAFLPCPLLPVRFLDLINLSSSNFLLLF
jgi:hypothetical protein